MGGDTLNHPAAEQGDAPHVRRSFWHRNRWIGWVAGAFFLSMVVITAVLSIIARHAEPFIRASLVEGLRQRFHTRVELAEFHISVHHGKDSEWGLWATGRGLRIWPPTHDTANQPDQTAPGPKPLIDLGEFSFHVPLRSETTMRLHIAEARLKGLVIDVPPRLKSGKQEGLEAAIGPAHDELAVPQPAPRPLPGQPGPLANITVDHVICDGAFLKFETDKPDKLPLEFEISRLILMNVSAGKPMEFQAELTNPRPRGAVATSGTFGPWSIEDPGASPVGGKYHFENADLSTFHGIAGILSSSGTYAGVLRELAVDGESDVPDFRLSSFGNSLHLHAKFHARVDATDGDTWLEPVDATLGRSHLTTRGKVVRVLAPAASSHAASAPAPAFIGHMIDLKVEIDRGNLEDLMTLVSRSPSPLLTGDLEANAALQIPPGVKPPQLRMKLDGTFKLTQAHFTSQKIQDKIEELSLRGQGRPSAMKTTDANTILSEMDGSFHVDHGVIALPDLHYAVPGADIYLKGSYALDGMLNFAGTASMQAPVSKMVGGWKGLLLKPVDRYFSKGGSGTLVPIHVRGSRDAPEFGVDLGRMKQTSPQRPGEARP